MGKPTRMGVGAMLTPQVEGGCTSPGGQAPGTRELVQALIHSTNQDSIRLRDKGHQPKGQEAQKPSPEAITEGRHDGKVRTCSEGKGRSVKDGKAGGRRELDKTRGQKWHCPRLAPTTAESGNGSH